MLPALDWQTPWFAPWRRWGEPVQDLLVREGGGVAQALARYQALAGEGLPTPAPRSFVPQAELPPGQAYEAFIYAQRRVPTRDNLHDFLNGLCWLRFPRAKARLNTLQAQAIARDGLGPVRGPLRDALTLFDENAILLQAPAPLWAALRQRDWQGLFVTHRTLWLEARVVLFGHALLEKLVQPYPAITGHVLAIPPEAGEGDTDWDAWLEAHLAPDWLATKPFEPLPVLGVPGWWPANADPAFYANAQVFRPRRQTAPKVAH